MNEQKIKEALNNLFRRLSTAEDWYDEIELSILSSEIFGTIGTLICCRIELEEMLVYDMGFNSPVRQKKKKPKGELDVKDLVDSPKFIKFVIKTGYDLLVGESSIWVIRYNSFDRAPTAFIGISIDPEKDKELIKSLVKFREPSNNKNRISILSFDKKRGLYTGFKEITLMDINIKDTYNDDLPNQELFEKLRNTMCGGLFLFHGEPGTGKTTYLRYVLQESIEEDYNLIVVPNWATELIGKPEFHQYCMDQPEGTVFIIEESEEIIRSRENGNTSPAISSLLNFCDGLIGHINNVKFICTFNTSEENIDEALRRKGRLQLIYEFRKLSLEKTRKFIPEATEPMPLSEIFGETIRPQAEKKKKIGFLV